MSRRQERHVKFDSEGLTARRLELRLTNEELARRAGVTLRTVQRWQAGETEPVGSQAIRLAQVLYLEPGALYLEEAAA